MNTVFRRFHQKILSYKSHHYGSAVLRTGRHTGSWIHAAVDTPPRAHLPQSGRRCRIAGIRASDSYPSTKIRSVMSLPRRTVCPSTVMTLSNPVACASEITYSRSS